MKNTPGVQQGTQETTCSALPKRCSSGLPAARLHLRRTTQSTQTSRGAVPPAATPKALRMELRHHRRAPATTGETVRCSMRPVLSVRPFPLMDASIAQGKGLTDSTGRLEILEEHRYAPGGWMRRCVDSQPLLKRDLVIDRRGASRPEDQTSPQLQGQTLWQGETLF